jgi:hypothetical protein|tara:strand:- start:566 stop:742 length:177 start_codon:yes stop_codon:yes gene_type:complete
VKNIIEHLLKILEHDSAEKTYINLKKYYEECGKIEEAEIIGHIIYKRFHEDNNNNSNV